MDIFVYHRTKTAKCRGIAPMVLPYIDVTLVLDGKLRYRINGEAVTLRAGDVVVFQPGDHRFRESGTAAEYVSFNIRLQPHDEIPYIRGVVRGFVNEDVRALLRQYENSRHATSRWEKAKSTHYFSILYYSLCEVIGNGGEDAHIIVIKQYIAAHLHERISLSQIADAAFLSPNYCNFLFKQHTGMTLSAYIISLRMEEAKRMLLYSDSAVADIAAALGYQDNAYFSRQFRKQTGYSPAEFRKKFEEEHLYHKKK